MSIGINVPAYPQMVVVPGYPVYYAPGLGANFFFYDGMYWVLEGDDWYMSSWYNGPWVIVAPAYVPYYLLRVPVRYYMAPPPYFGGWQPGAPPRWGRHWGPQWEQQHHDWDRWNRRAMPGPSPLPSYQRRYAGELYPSPGQQADLQARNYRYQPRSEAARQQLPPLQMERDRGVPAAAPRRPQMEAPQAQRPAQRPQEWPPQQEPRGGGPPPRYEAGPRMQPQPMPPQPVPMAAPNAPQHPAQGRGEPQERGHGKGHGDDGKDRRDQGGPPGR
ncbi:hypothetical protein [Roseateles saccharophilus]|uniref:hypothetical protein n=1 Tax=Roseateles saccharophilus TaxID=304 RepID=UPI001045AE72|nr:hypothetical protein [Roseateles saccharophilus]MDG0835245.1 hypothetical protein [Roseateles saccharophilus]